MVSSDTTMNQQLLKAVPPPTCTRCLIVVWECSPVVLEVDLSDDQHEVVGDALPPVDRPQICLLTHLVNGAWLGEEQQNKRVRRSNELLQQGTVLGRKLGSE